MSTPGPWLSHVNVGYLHSWVPGRAAKIAATANPPTGPLSTGDIEVLRMVADAEEREVCESGVAMVDDDAVACRLASMRASKSGGVPGCAGYATSPQPAV